MNRIKSNPWLFTLLPVLIGILLIYLPGLKNGFVWDDIHSFFNDPMYRDPANLKKALTGALIYQENFFRPLPVLTFLIQIHVFELSAAKMHLVSILLHVVNTGLIMMTAVELLRRKGGSFPYLTAALTGLVYGLHPVLIEPVSFIASRFDMMMTTFLLLALYLDRHIVNQWLRAFAVGTLFLLAALCKEMAVGFALALPFWHYFIQAQDKFSLKQYWQVTRERGDFKVYIAVLISGLVYLFLRYQALGLIFDSSLYGNKITLTTAEHFALIGLSINKYLSLLFLPFGSLSVAHAIPNHPVFSDYKVILGYGFLLGIPAATLAFKKWQPAILAGYASLLASLLPILGIIPLPRNPGMYFAESFLTLPAAFFVLLLTRPLNAIVSSDVKMTGNMLKSVRAILAFWLLFSVITVSSTIPVWKNNIALWSWAKFNEPGNVPVRDNLAAAYLNAKNYRGAVDESVATIQLDHINDVAWNNLALGLAGLAEFKDAESAARKAIAINPGKTGNRVTLAKIYYFSKNYKAAISTIEYILKQKPDDIPSMILAANVYRETGEKTLAREFMLRAIEHLPAGKERGILIKWLDELG